MWRTEDGDRVLTKAEWRLFVTGLDLLQDWVETDIRAGSSDLAEVGMKAFDSLSPEQKLVVLTELAQALHDEETPPPFQTAANEAALAAILDCVKSLIETEIDAQEKWDVRQLMLDAIGDDPDREYVLPSAECTDMDEWQFLLEEIESRVFWDYDFVMEDCFLDLPPEQSRAAMEELGIDPDYYLATPREPTESELQVMRRKLADLKSRADG